MKNTTNTLIERIRNKKNNPRGVLVARKLGPKTYAIGWSLCSKTDKFDMNTGVTMALVGQSIIRKCRSPLQRMWRNF